MTKPGAGDNFYRMNGGGEMLVYSAADFEDFFEPRPEMPDSMEAELKSVVWHLAENRWPFRLHTTYEETMSRTPSARNTCVRSCCRCLTGLRLPGYCAST